MPLPKRITPDSIIDATVEVKYLSNLPFELLVGFFFSALDDSYHYTSRAMQPNLPALPFTQGSGITFNMGVQPLFYNDHISIRLAPNTVIFGCLNNKYIGWDVYRVEIEKVLKAFEGTGHISKWVRIGIRYITEYLNKDLKECTKFTFTFGLPDVRSSSTTFRSEFPYKAVKAILTLNNQMPSIRQQASSSTVQIVQTSVIDLDVIREPLDIAGVGDLMNVVNATHEIEKELFFNLLTEEFLKTLNPEY